MTFVLQFFFLALCFSIFRKQMNLLVVHAEIDKSHQLKKANELDIKFILMSFIQENKIKNLKAAVWYCLSGRKMKKKEGSAYY